MGGGTGNTRKNKRERRYVATSYRDLSVMFGAIPRAIGTVLICLWVSEFQIASVLFWFETGIVARDAFSKSNIFLNSGRLEWIWAIIKLVKQLFAFLSAFRA